MSRPARSHRLAALLLAAVLTITAGCEGLDYRPDAVGPEGVVTVVIDSTLWEGTVGDALRASLGEYLGTLPAPERRFELQQVEIDSQRQLEQLQSRKNLVFVGPLADSSNVSNFLRARLPEDALQRVLTGDEVVYAKRPDLWRQRQMVVYLAAAEPDGLVDAIQARAADLVDAFDDVTRQRMTIDMFEKGRQEDLEERLLEEYGFTVNVQHDYFVAVDTTDFVWLRRVLTDTWRSMFIHFEEDANPGLLSPEWIYATRDSLTREYLQGNVAGFVQIDRRRPLETETIEFLGHFGFETRGLWHMVGPDGEGNIVPYGMGGPFVNYTFYDQESGRVYMIDGMVFAPGFDKREFLRQMEVIAHTFRSGPAGEPAPGDAAASGPAAAPAPAE